MMAARETMAAGSEPAADKPALVSITADERAQLVWGDEANAGGATGTETTVNVVKTAPDSTGQLWPAGESVGIKP